MRRIDHIVVAVRELDKAAEFYRRIGFQVGARNRHPWGTENRLIQFGSSFVELITESGDADLIEPHQSRQFSFGAFVRDYLQNREGIAMLVLSSADAKSDAALFAERGIGEFEPFSFSRRGVRPDGSETQVAFTLAFATDEAAPDLAFFVCQQHYPENFWNHAFQRHANSAKNIATVTLAAPQPERHARFLSAFSGAAPVRLQDAEMTFRVQEGQIDVVPAILSNHSHQSPALKSFSVRVDDLPTVRHILAQEGIPFTLSEQRIVLAPPELHGLEIRFETTHAW